MKKLIICSLFSILLTIIAITAYAQTEASLPSAKFFDGKTGQILSQSDLLQRLSDANVIFLAEEHGNTPIHQWQLELLKTVNSIPGGVALSMEQFERDKQSVLNDYLQNRINEDFLLANGRVWPNYLDSYKPLIEFAKTNCIPVIASNLPKDIAKEVSKSGIEFLMTISVSPFTLAAENHYSPFEGKYWENFQKTMTMHGMPMDKEKIKHFYEAQCLKDDTMAESIVNVMHSRIFTRVVHTNGNFHSDYGLGTPERVLRLMPEARVINISMITVEEDTSEIINKTIQENLTRGEIIIIIKSPKKETKP